MKNKKTSSKAAEKSKGEFVIRFNKTTEVVETLPKSNLQELCAYLIGRAKQMGDPEKVIFPNGNEYLWGETGAWLTHQFAAKGRITEKEFIHQLLDHNDDDVVIMENKVNEIKVIVNGWKAVLKQAEQKTSEVRDSYDKAFDGYIKARGFLQTLKEEVRHDS